MSMFDFAQVMVDIGDEHINEEIIIEFKVGGQDSVLDEINSKPCEEVFIEAEFTPSMGVAGNIVLCDEAAKDVTLTPKPMITIKPELEKYNLMRFLKMPRLPE